MTQPVAWNTPRKVTIGIRLAAMLLDHFLMTAVLAIPLLMIIASKFSQLFSGSVGVGNKLWGSWSYLICTVMAVYCCKDSFNGRSPAKRLLKLQVVDHKSGLAATPLQCMVRNLFILVWPVEVIVTLVNPSRRIGDRVAGTHIVYYDPQTAVPAKAQWVKVVLAFLISVAVVTLWCKITLWPLHRLSDAGTVHYVAGTYNEAESKKLEQIFREQLGDYLEPAVKIYDSIQGAPLKYIEIDCRVKARFDEHPEQRDVLLQTLYKHYPISTFSGNLRFVYKAPMQLHTAVESIGVSPFGIMQER
ncbi:RDD family protein [Taibaiella koreensis]|uniref:RDD family protein n=1 Tax=Taibaiella koreensis TaxID=1268548 RepID=UPI000E59BF86|nr:RDD family protein [Taibaiella koreensis]